jgi:hypothetical protein
VTAELPWGCDCGEGEACRYLDGDCELLALAISHLTGWPIVATWGEDPDEGFHALVQLPGGELLDCRGLHGAAAVGELHPYAGSVARPPAEHEWRQPGILADAAELLEQLEEWRE